MHFLLTVCKRAEKEKKTKIEELFEEKNSKLEENETFTHIVLSSESSISGVLSEEEESSSDEEEDNWEDNPDSLSARRSLWLDTGNTLYIKEKLVQILAKKVPIPK